MIGERVWRWLPHATFIRVSADAGDRRDPPAHARLPGRP